jgi:hypothetical protein
LPFLLLFFFPLLSFFANRPGAHPSRPLFTPNPQSTMSCRPGGPPRPHLPATPTPAPHLPSSSCRHPPCARPWRPRLRWQASRCCLAINAPWPPSMPAAPTGHRPRSRPRSDRVEHAPWTPRACTAFSLMHTSSPLAPHTVLHDIKRAFT